MSEMSAEQVREVIGVRIRNAGSLTAFAQKSGVSHGYVSDVMNGRREPGSAMLAVLGLERVVTYRTARP